MLDYQKLDVYQKARVVHKEVLVFLEGARQVPNHIKNQLSRLALSFMLNAAESAGRFSNPDKRHFFY